MPVDPNIALGFRQPEIESPLNNFAKFAAIRAADNQNALAQYQLSTARRADEEANAMRASLPSDFDINNPAHVNALLKGSPVGGAALIEKLAKVKKEQTDTQKMQSDVIDAALKRSRGLLSEVTTPEEYMQWHIANHNDPTIGPLLKARGVTPEASAKKIVDEMAKPGGFQQLLQQSALGLDKFTELNKPTLTPQNLQDRERVLSTPGLGGPSTVVAGSEAKTGVSPNTAATVEESRRAHDMADKRARDFNEISKENRAPSITTIIDPTNPNQMLSIDARRYKGGGNGSAGVIGVSGKEPGAALRENKAEKGRTDILDTIDQLRAEYNALDATRDMPSTGRNVASNVAASVTRLPGGQTMARMAGTEAQSHRDVIQSSKLQLLNAIKQATGMSAQQLNSNVELQTWLNAVSDPYQAKETVDKILDNIEAKYGKGEKVPSRSAGGPITTAPAPGTVQDGYRFKGGDPSQRTNWVKEP